jgi:hypothetical protein
MNTQELFDKVAKHLLTQNAKALDSRGGCVYRAADGKMCAVGCLIDDKHYASDLEGKGISIDEIDTDVCTAVIQSIGSPLDPHQLHMLQDLQSVHDDISPEEWPEELHNFAEEYDLSTAILHA